MADSPELNARHAKRLHHTMSAVGGFFAGYIVTAHGVSVLANAQTMNLIQLTVALLGRDLGEVLLRVCAFLLYCLGVMGYVWLRDLTRVNLHRASIALDALAVVVMLLIPDEADIVVHMLPLFLAMSFQWNAFLGSEVMNSATVFSTNNTRQMSMALAEWLMRHDGEKLRKVAFFALTLLMFHVGVSLAWGATRLWGTAGVLLALLPLAIAMLQTHNEPRRQPTGNAK